MSGNNRFCGTTLFHTAVRLWPLTFGARRRGLSDALGHEQAKQHSRGYNRLTHTFRPITKVRGTVG
jgi:hypothetical protein